jgi:hypothetical protein
MLPHVAEVLSAATAIVSTLRPGNVVVGHHSYTGLDGVVDGATNSNGDFTPISSSALLDLMAAVSTLVHDS